MRFTRCFVVLVFALAFPAFAELNPGPVVRTGQAFPVVADFNGDGLDDLIQDRNVLLSDGASFSEAMDLRLSEGESVVGVLDANGDRIPDLLVAAASGMMAPP